jgi:ribonuclease Z
VERLLAATGDRPSYPVRVRQVEPGDVVLDREAYEVRAFATDHDTRAVGYALVESERKGRFDRERAEEEFGIPPGPKYSTLHAGEPVEHEGRTIQPEEVVGPSRPGRRVVYTGDTRPTGATVAAAEDADLLVHDGTFGDEHEERAAKTGHSTAREAASVAREAGASALALVHVSPRYAGRADQLAAEAREVFGETVLACDGMQVEIPFPDSEESPTVERPQC